MNSALKVREKRSRIGAPNYSLPLIRHCACRVGWHQTAVEPMGFRGPGGWIALYFVCFQYRNVSEIDGCFLKLCPVVWLMGLFHLALWSQFDLELGLITSLGRLQAWWPGEGTSRMLADCSSAPTPGKAKDCWGLRMPVLSLAGSRPRLFKKTLLLKNNK